jgi:hypothetical protein
LPSRRGTVVVVSDIVVVAPTLVVVVAGAAVVDDEVDVTSVVGVEDAVVVRPEIPPGLHAVTRTASAARDLFISSTS